MLAVAAAAILATYSGSTLNLTLRYEMTCGQPGPGPLVVRLPTRFRLAAPRALVDGVVRARAVNGSVVTIALPKPPQVTCMSITMGRLRVRLTGVHAPRGIWTIRAALPRHSFVTQLRVAGTHRA